MRRLVLVALLTVTLSATTVLLVGCSDEEQAAPRALRSTADFFYYDTVEEVTSAADIIITGKVVGLEEREININGGPDRETNPFIEKCAVSLIEVKRVMKGDVEQGDIVEVKQELSLVDQQEPRIKKKNGVGIFFLAAYPDGVPCSLVNPEQGMIAIENGKAKPDSDNVLFDTAKTEDDVLAEIETATE